MWNTCKTFDLVADRTVNIRQQENKEILNVVQVVSQRKFIGNMNSSYPCV